VLQESLYAIFFVTDRITRARFPEVYPPGIPDTVEKLHAYLGILYTHYIQTDCPVHGQSLTLRMCVFVVTAIRHLTGREDDHWRAHAGLSLLSLSLATDPHQALQPCECSSWGFEV
jgi:hypothetical protein